MRRCVKCVIPDTRPGIVFNADGVCSACVNHSNRSTVDWAKRKEELVELCASLREHPNELGYDCIIAVSGGKDSHFQVKTLKEDFGLNPLLVTVNNLPDDWTGTGIENANNLTRRFDCERISLDLSPATAKKMFRYSFEKYGSPAWFWDRAVYTYPLWIAHKFNIPTVFYGENISYEYGGPAASDTPSAKAQLVNNVANAYCEGDYIQAGITDMHRMAWMNLSEEVVDSVNPLYLSYYLPWSGAKNRLVAEANGFKPLPEWDGRNGFIDNYDQIDATGYLVHCWMKYPKYGHARATDVASYWIRDGLISRDKAMELVEKNDHILDETIRQAFCRFCGYSNAEFWEIVRRHTKPEYLQKVLLNVGL